MKSYIKMSERLKTSTKEKAATHKKGSAEALRFVEELRGKRAAALAEGRQEDYDKLGRDIEYYQGRAKIEAEQANKTDIPRSQFTQAWEEYREDYDREFDKRAKAYNKLKEQLAKAYSELLEYMNEGNRERLAYVYDVGAGLWEEQMPRLSTLCLKDESGHKISIDGILLASVSDNQVRISDNVHSIECGSYADGGLYGESAIEAIYKKRPSPSRESRFLWEENGKSEYLTLKEIRQRRLARLTEKEKAFLEQKHG